MNKGPFSHTVKRFPRKIKNALDLNTSLWDSVWDSILRLSLCARHCLLLFKVTRRARWSDVKLSFTQM